ncbi:vWA domain-containing protein [Altibacter sp. HG106]|uniref:vWA domain-containing protein n=1 Tax=Altibacter sp. HG106 TaxID=3023937 RepID=UPI002350D4BF|nr:VWA domain-containing protein [Altibacter sp. HG106]MDC7995469.1 VWA domain-containing protein [Altibacter sp. HG106]
MKKVILLLLLSTTVSTLSAQSGEATAPIMFIYDGSGSMWGQMNGKTKMEIASEVLSASVSTLAETQRIGLVAYGHRQKSDCKDVETLVPLNNISKSTITSAIKGIKPLGKTPLAYSASLVIDQLRKSKEKATIILITDGIESCDGNICELVRAAKKEGIDFKLHIVGFGLKQSETGPLKCAAEAGEGNYYDAADATGLSEVMNEAMAETIDKREGNFGVFAKKNGKAIDAYVKAYKAGTDQEMGSLRTYGETRYMYLPEGTYDLVAYPLGSSVEAITITGEKSLEDQKTERTISFDGGKMAVLITNNDEGWDATVSVVNKKGERISGGRTYGRTKELEVNPGTYDLKIQALQMEGMHTVTEIKDVVVTGAKTTPVAYDFTTGTLSLNVLANGEDIDTMVTVTDLDADKRVAGGRTYNRGITFLLNPGTYEFIITPLGIHKSKPKRTFTYVLKKGDNHSEKITYN